MLNETPAQLVAHLTHPNGWWRDTAQRLLVLKQDKSVVPALQADRADARTTCWRASTRCGRSRGSARSTLALVREQMKDRNPRMRVQAIRASETLYKAGDNVARRRLPRADEGQRSGRRDSGDADVEPLQAARRRGLIKETMEANKARGVQEIGELLLQRLAAAATTRRPASRPSSRSSWKEGRDHLQEPVLDLPRRGRPRRGRRRRASGAMMAPPLAGSPRVQGHRDYVIKVLLHGMTGPLAGQTYTQVMVPMGAQNDEWIADIASYVRNTFGNTAPFIAPADVARVRAATASRKTMWTLSGARGDAAAPAAGRTDVEGDRESQRRARAAAA